MEVKQPIPLNVGVIPLANLERVGGLFLPIKPVSDGKKISKTLVLYCVVVLRQHRLPETTVERVFVLLETDC